MIAKIPGWLNFFLVWLFYYLIMEGLKWWTGFQVDDNYIKFSTCVYAGAYLAKWRFYPKGVDLDGRFW